MPELLNQPVSTDEKRDRKRRKRALKLVEDAERPPRSMERWRILMEAVDEGRRLIDLVDHRARYALVIMGALNAGIFLIVSRAHLLSGLTQWLKPWMIAMLVLYAVLTVVFLLFAIDCLRPRRMHSMGLLAAAPGFPTPSRRDSLGLLYWETTASYPLPDYQAAWRGIRMEQVIAELVLIHHHLARILASKYAALGRLYAGLAALVMLATVQLLVFVVLSL